MRKSSKCFKIIVFTFLCLYMIKTYGQENAAPSIHLVYKFSSKDAVLKMQKIKITKSAYASYFEVNSFTNGYAGLQQTVDKSIATPFILLSSLWDANTAGGIYSVVDYKAAKTFKSRFGGEGDGYKTIYPYNWKINTWYNLVNRAWKSAGRLYTATFINDLSTGIWLHTATLSIPDPGKYLRGYNDAFLENWDGTKASSNGSLIRQAFFKDCWILNTESKWENFTSVSFSANDGPPDKKRNGIYHNSFNAYYDSTENAYCMQHGGNTKPSPAFSGGRVLQLPLPINQSNAPVLPIAAIRTLNVKYKKGVTAVEWEIDEYKTPQLSAQVEIIDASGNVLKMIQDTLPQRRKFLINSELKPGNYSIRLTVTDIFNQLSQPATTGYQIPFSNAKKNPAHPARAMQDK